MLLRITCAQSAPSAATRLRLPGRARPASRLRRRCVAASTSDGEHKLLLSFRSSSFNSQSTAPITKKGKLRSWVGPNGQYYRELPCPSCRGRGYTPCKECGIDRSSLDCPMCNGKVNLPDI